MKNNANKSHLRIRALCEGAILVALAFVLSFVKLYELPNGGSLTPAMFPILLFALRFGLGRGLLAGFVFGLLQMIFDGAYAWGWQVCSRAKPGAFSPAPYWDVWAVSSFTTFPALPSTGSLNPPPFPASAPLTMPIYIL